MTFPGQLAERVTRRQTQQALPNAQVKPIHLTNQFDAHTDYPAMGTYAA